MFRLHRAYPRLITSLTVIIATLFFTVASEAQRLDQTGHPNIVIIMVDDMGYGDPGCYNPQSKIPTPNIDSLASAGMRFTDAHAPGPLCHLSRYGFMTGRFPFRATTGQWRKKPSINKGQVTIASLLSDNGYQTAMVGKWHLGFDESRGYEHSMPGGPIDCGFDTFFGIRASTDIPPYFYIRGDKAIVPPTDEIAANNSTGWTNIQGAFWRAGGIAPGMELKNVLPRFTDEAIDVIRKYGRSGQSKPLMLYLAYPAPHTPWLPSQQFEGKSQASTYGDFSVMVDAMIGKVLGALDDTDMSDDTLVIFTSDNGPVWYQEDVDQFGHDSSGGLRGMKADAWEAGHRMPFIARWPGRVKRGVVSDQMICFTDLLRTFADIVDAELPAGAGPDSVSFLPVLLGDQPESRPVRDTLVVVSGSGTRTIRKGNWKLIEGLGSGGFSEPRKIQPSRGGPSGQLYDLSIDLGETKNLYSAKPEIVKRMTQSLRSTVRGD